MSVVGLSCSRLSLLALALLLADRHDGEMGRFQYERSIQANGGGPICAVLDATVFAHAAGSLKDVRLFRNGQELPYAIAVNEAAQAGNDVAAVVNLRADTSGAEFDLVMPSRAYTQVLLQMQGKDFVARGEVWGVDRPGPGKRVPLGHVALFDLSARGLGRTTLISLQESSFRFLHVVLRGSGFQVLGAEVPPSREGQTLFTTVAETHDVTERENETIARFRLAARVPVERVDVSVASNFKGNFSREVRVRAAADAPGSVPEQVMGRILRVKTSEVAAEQDTFPASLGANLQEDATVEVAIENEERGALPVTSVALAMRQRTICFEAYESESTRSVVLRYGDTSLAAPGYSYQPGPRSRLAVLGLEKALPEWHGPVPRIERGNRIRALTAAGLLTGLALLWSIVFGRKLLGRWGRSLGDG